MLSTGVIIGAVVLAVLLIITLAGVYGSLNRKSRGLSLDESGWAITMCVGGALLFIGLIIASFVWYPFNFEKYQTVQYKDGIIAETTFDMRASINSRVDNGGLRVRLGDGTYFYTTDFRLAGKTPGTRVSLVCSTGFDAGLGDRVDCVARTGAS